MRYGWILVCLACRTMPEAPDWYRGTMLISKDGEVVRRGYGFDPGKPFWIASISKQFTAAAILRLEEEGRISTADPIGKLIGGAPEDKRAITIHQLLTHTAGFAKNYAADGISDRDAAIRALLEKPLLNPPGTEFGYSNDAYNLLAAIVEIAAGEPFEAYLSRELLVRAGLKSTGFWGEGSSVAPIIGAMDAASMMPNWGFRGATGMYSTIDDLLRWYRALPSVLSQASLQKLWAPHVPISDGHACYGWFVTNVQGRKSLWTRGTEQMGHNAILMTFPDEDLVIAAASNAGDRDGIAASRKLAEELAEALLAP